MDDYRDYDAYLRKKEIEYFDRLKSENTQLARRVIAAEKLVEALSLIADGHSWPSDCAVAALIEWDAAQ